MTSVLRRHVTLPPETVAFLERYQAEHGLENFSATLVSAAQALAREERLNAYQQYAQDYAADPQEQAFAAGWLDTPMDER